ncbi:hypothetical protein CN605_20070 [Bacillus toyonensis]|uniref:KAP family P-loop NTPase fold protein n=1 Tax=Bacillus toyonensis TaxID=155322 RepID=UPI000BF1C21E|nr:P-loop NTPase fold protein [Bacillus toyonensis]PEL42681.1 hypothetical protein CN605_20070 [Bacillus toyonensis]
MNNTKIPYLFSILLLVGGGTVLTYIILNLIRYNLSFINKLLQNPLWGQSIVILYIFILVTISVLYLFRVKKTSFNKYNYLLLTVSLGVVWNYKFTIPYITSLQGNLSSNLFDLSYYFSFLGIFCALIPLCNYIMEKCLENLQAGESAVGSPHDPIKTKSMDRLNREKFAQHFSNWITKYSYNNITIGLFGKWGSGKSSVFNLTKNHLNKDKSCITMNFNPWYYASGSQEIIGKFLSELNKVLKKEKWGSTELEEHIWSYSRLFSSVSMRPPGLIINLKEIFSVLDNKQEDMDSLKQSIEQELSELNKKIVVFIDDIDRLDSEEIQAIFKLIREICNFSNMIYILALDDEMVARSLGEMMSSESKDITEIGKSYLEKFIQLPIFLPSTEIGKLQTLIDEELLNIFEENELKSINKDAIIMYILEMGLTIRNIHRYFTMVSFFKPMLEKEVNFNDLLLLFLIKIGNYELYKFIASHPIYFIKEIDKGIREEKREEIESFKNEFLKYENILISLSPYAAQLFNKDILVDSREKLKREKRLADEESFLKYFIYGVPDVEVSFSEFNVFLHSLKLKRIDELEKDYKELIGRYSAKNINALILAHTVDIDGMEFAALVNLLCRVYKDLTIPDLDLLIIIRIISKGMEAYNEEIFNSDLFKSENIGLAFRVYQSVKRNSQIKENYIKKLDEVYSVQITNELLNDKNLSSVEIEVIFKSWIMDVKGEKLDEIRKDLLQIVQTPSDLEKIISFIYAKYIPFKPFEDELEENTIIFEYAKLLKYLDWELMYKLSTQIEEVEMEEEYQYISIFDKLDKKVYSIIGKRINDLYDYNTRKVEIDDIHPAYFRRDFQMIFYRGNRAQTEEWDYLLQFEV